MDCTELRMRFDTAKSVRTNIESTFEVIERFVVPFRGRFFYSNLSELEVDWRKRDIFDATAVIANQNLASNLHAGLTNPSIQWFEIIFRDKDLNKDQEAKRWLEEVSRRVYVALQESNFNLEANEAYLDICSYGTSVVVEEVEEDNGAFESLNFSATPIVQCHFEQNADGGVEYFYRELQWTPVQMLTKFGQEGIPKEIYEEAMSSKGLDKRYTVIYCVYPVQANKKNDTRQILPPDQRPYAWKYFLHKDSTELGEGGGYYEMPAFVPRWRSNVESMWGYSPAMIVLSDILTLNQLVELILKSAEKVVDPPILTTRRGVFGDIDLDPAGVTVVQNTDSITPFISGARFDVSHLEKRELQQGIREAFFMDQLELKESPAMTATEVNARMVLMQRLMGPTLSRLQADFLDPLIKRTFMILMRYKQLPTAPDVVRDAGAELDIEYMGPMARSQKAEIALSIERWIGTVAAMSEQYPEAKDLVNIDESVRELGNAGGVPASVINSDTEVTTIREKREADMKKAQELQMAEQGGKAMQEVGAGLESMKGVIPGGQAATAEG